MKLVSIIAENAPAALARIHEQLGPDAVVVSVRRLPAHGLARLWHKGGQIEVLACGPDARPAHKTHSVPEGEDAYVPFRDQIEAASPAGAAGPRRWHAVSWLESLGLLPEFADRLEQQVQALHGKDPPPMPIAEWSAVREALMGCWRPAPDPGIGTGRPHVFIGPPGSGKTTVLCKWLTTAVLSEERSALVWRLDGVSANASEFLSLHGEMLGVPVARCWSGPPPADLLFVDLPGVETGDALALATLREQLAALPQPHVHLVLNAAYETATLFEQVRAFAVGQPEDLIFTHLDEERRRVKLWNFLLGTNCSLSFLSAGQKIPGEFWPADSALLFPHRNHP